METIKVHILHCGKVRVDSSLPFSEKTWNPISYTGILRGNKYQIWLPVSAYLIEHPKGLILVDTGWHTDVRIGDQGRKHMGFIHWLINKSDLPEGQAINEQLAQLGYKDTDIDYLVLSHLHSDHVNGLKLVKNAKKIIVNNLEMEDAIKMPYRYVPSMWENINIETYQFEKSNLGPQNLSYDLFGDQSIVFVNTPGHTHGLTSIIIQNNGKFLLLASDTGYAKKSWEQMILPGVQVDKNEVIASLQWTKMMSEKPNCIEVIANHDVDVLTKIIEL
ncbi:N-acyl homoserine lactonase family protein [Chishuiella sp.]|uniref:N-acyl homoserine lactonase family protein n=1 Tax=Chishuiella sp. TaxID=1969467 RepID=UPI0028AE8A39|nr:N-acyl homoserine lactonase family protein [Chishuiella sp.]